MRTLLSLMALCFMAYCSSVHAKNCQKDGLITIPADGAEQVFLGRDMPKSGCYLVNVIGKDQSGVPRNEGEAVNRVVDSLPAWLYVAVGLSSGDTECLAQVNKLDYFGIVISMWVDKWRNDANGQPSFLEDRTFEGDPAADRLQEDSCKRIKEQMKVAK